MSNNLKSGTVVQFKECRIKRLGDHLSLSGSQGEEVRCRPGLLGVLEYFSQPRSLAEAARKPAFAHDWIHYTRSILALIDAGILQIVDGPHPEDRAEFGLDPRGFGGAREHIYMLNDRARTQAYLQALEQTLQPGDTVIDLGCGTGILAAAAARRGAGKVHAIERSGIAEAAERFLSKNHLAGRVQLHKTVARNVRLDEPGDLLVTELVGNEPLSERILEYVIDAKARLLKPGAVIVPAALEIYAQCFSINPAIVGRYQFAPADAQNWTEWYGLDFSELAELRTHRPLAIDLLPSTLIQSTPCCEPQLVASIDFREVNSANVRSEVALAVTKAAKINAVHISFNIRLAKDIHLSRLYKDLAEDSSWDCRLWLPKHPIQAEPGDKVVVVYSHDPTGSHLEFK